MSFFARSESNAELAGAQLARQATASLAGLLAGLGKTRSDLAKAMGVSPGRVSQIMSGDANLTVRTLAAAAEALGADVEIRFSPRRPHIAEGQSAGSGESSPLRGSGIPTHR
ncbi:helix-turn-helix domain-containing protein [Streptomyces sp. NPDC048710]|uniref:helix-turn-helix domain-containing protein n=1 Tax=unclassified Streptomyces TaxID=2593676 RepID=UPI0037240CD6